jgi:hypothetical protein
VLDAVVLARARDVAAPTAALLRSVCECFVEGSISWRLEVILLTGNLSGRSIIYVDALLESLRGGRGIGLTNERDDALSSSDHRVLTAIRTEKRYNVQCMLKVACMHGN